MLQTELDKLPANFQEKVKKFSDDWVVAEVINPATQSPIIPFEIRKHADNPVNDTVYYIEVQDGKIVGTPPELATMIGWTGEQLMKYVWRKNISVTKLPF